MQRPAELHPLIRKLETIFDLRAEERDAIGTLPYIVRELRADQDIVRDQDRPSHCCIILEGFAYRYKMIEGGKRQIFSFHMSGDMPDLQSLHLQIMDHSLATMSACKIALIQHEPLRAFLRTHPRIAEALWRDTLIDAAIFREWITNVGRREAHPRIAHLICEIFVRMRALGLTEGTGYEMPVTQEELGDALGLSTVHVNRTMQQLRAEGLIATPRARVMTILNWDGLRSAAEFDPTYLHLREPVAALA